MEGLPALEEFDAVVVAVAREECGGLEFGGGWDGRVVVFDLKGLLPRELVDGRL